MTIAVNIFNPFMTIEDRIVYHLNKVTDKEIKFWMFKLGDSRMKNVPIFFKINDTTKFKMNDMINIQTVPPNPQFLSGVRRIGEVRGPQQQKLVLDFMDQGEHELTIPLSSAGSLTSADYLLQFRQTGTSHLARQYRWWDLFAMHPVFSQVTVLFFLAIPFPLAYLLKAFKKRKKRAAGFHV